MDRRGDDHGQLAGPRRSGIARREAGSAHRVVHLALRQARPCALDPRHGIVGHGGAPLGAQIATETDEQRRGGDPGSDEPEDRH